MRILALLCCAPLLAACNTEPAPTQPPATSASQNQFQDLASCMADKGWQVTANADSVDAYYPEEQAEQFQVSLAECSEEVGLPSEPPSLSAAELQEQYAMLLRVANCLRGEDLPVDEAPSEETYIASFEKDPLGVWHPYDAVAKSGLLTKAMQLCPVDQ